MWAVPGTDFCLLHGGKIPQTIAEANERVAAARTHLETPIVYDAMKLAEGHITVEMMRVGSITPDVLILKSRLIERIETKIEEYMETGYHWEDGILDGLKIALDIIDTF